MNLEDIYTFNKQIKMILKPNYKVYEPERNTISGNKNYDTRETQTHL